MLPMRHVIAVCLLVAGPVVTTAGCASGGEGPERIVLHSRAPERGNWTPREVHLVLGRAVTLEVRNVDVVTHSLYVPAFNLDTGPIRPGESRAVTFAPDSVGDFLFTCGIWCSDYHMYERGRLIVEPATGRP